MNEHGKFFEQKQRCKELELELVQLKRKYEMALEGFEGGILQVRYFPEQEVARVAFASDKYLEMIGYTRKEYERLSKENRTNDVMDGKDQKKIVENIKNRLFHGEKEATYYRINTKQGKLKWFQCMITIIEVSSDNVLLQMHFADVTDLKEVQNRLEIERSEFELFASIASFNLFRYNIQADEIVYYNIQNGRVNEIAEKSFLQVIESGLLYKSDIEGFMEQWKNLTERQDELSMIYRRKGEDEKYDWVQADVRFLRDEDGNTISVVGRLSSLNETKQKFENAK